MSGTGNDEWLDMPPGVERVLAMQAAGVNSSPSDLGDEGMAQFEREGRERRARQVAAQKAARQTA